MACPKVDLRGKLVILLSGFRDGAMDDEPVEIEASKVLAIKQLEQAATRHPDAIAFGYVEGHWVPAA